MKHNIERRLDSGGRLSLREKRLAGTALVGLLLATGVGGKSGYDYATRQQHRHQDRGTAIRGHDNACLQLVQTLASDNNRGPVQVRLDALTTRQQQDCGFLSVRAEVTQAVDGVRMPLDARITLPVTEALVRLPSKLALTHDIEAHPPRKETALNEAAVSWTLLGSALGALTMTAVGVLLLELHDRDRRTPNAVHEI